MCVDVVDLCRMPGTIPRVIPDPRFYSAAMTERRIESVFLFAFLLPADVADVADVVLTCCIDDWFNCGVFDVGLNV